LKKGINKAEYYAVLKFLRVCWSREMSAMDDRIEMD